MDIRRMFGIEKFLAYISTRHPVLEENGIFCDETKNYRIPQDPKPGEPVKLRLRTKKNNVEKVYLRYEDKRLPLKRVSSDALFDYYEIMLEGVTKPLQYYFELSSGRYRVFYNKKGATREADHYFDFKLVPGLATPDWAKGAIMYQIFVDRFYNGNPANDVADGEYRYIGELAERVKDWNKLPAADGIREFYGGDLQGVRDKLDYLQEIGVEVIYLNPVFTSPSNHKYDTQDYEAIDPHFAVIVEDGGATLTGEEGNEYASLYQRRTTSPANIEASNAFFAELVEEIHRRGMRVILDGVFNHCGSFNKWLDREGFYGGSGQYPAGAYTSATSPYHSYFHFHETDSWPNNSNYDGWWGYDTLPKLNYEGSPGLYRKIMKVAQKWVGAPYKTDGWRLDVAADLGYSKEFNHQFWRDFRSAVKEANPEALILAEHYGDPSDWLKNGDQWDSVMNYDAFMEPVSWFFTGMEKHSDEHRGDLFGNYQSFCDTMTYNMAKFSISALQVAMNELSNHDHSRFLTRTNHRVGRTASAGAEAAGEGLNYGIMKEAVVLQMTWLGAPTIYYGDEAGVCGWTDPDNRRTYPWGNENKELLNVHKQLIALRKSIPTLRSGSLKMLGGEYNVLTYGRFDERDKIVVAFNNNADCRQISIPVWEIGISDDDSCQRIFESTADSHNTAKEMYPVENGRIKLRLKPFSAVILKKAGY